MKHVIESIREPGPVALIIRHAERDPITDMNSPFDAMLTEKGIRDAADFGRQISITGPVRIYHSPVPRCRDTARHIYGAMTGFRPDACYEGDIGDLGAPYIRGDWSRIAALIRISGQDAFLRQWFNGTVPDDIIMPFEEAFVCQMRILLRQLTENTCSTINVSHDWNILILREAAFGLRHEELGMPDFLDGMALQIHDRDVHLYYHEHHTKAPLKDFMAASSQ